MTADFICNSSCLCKGQSKRFYPILRKKSAHLHKTMSHESLEQYRPTKYSFITFSVHAHKRNTHSRRSLWASKTSGLFYWEALIYLWNATVQGCLFLPRAEQKLPLMWSFHNPTPFIYQGTDTQTKTDSHQKSTKTPPFFVSRCFFLFFTKSGCVSGGEWCIDVAIR